MTDKSPDKITVAEGPPFIEFVAPIAGQHFATATDKERKPSAHFALFDNAFKGDVVLRNDPDDADNFVGSDSERFYIRVTDASAKGEPEIYVDWSTLDVTNVLDTGKITLKPTKVPGVFVSRGLVLVADPKDRIGVVIGKNKLVNPGEDDYPIRHALLDGRTRATYPSGKKTKATAELLVWQLSERRTLVLRLFVQVRKASGAADATEIPVVSNADLLKDLERAQLTYATLGIDVVTISHSPPGDRITVTDFRGRVQEATRIRTPTAIKDYDERPELHREKEAGAGPDPVASGNDHLHFMGYCYDDCFEFSRQVRDADSAAVHLQDVNTIRAYYIRRGYKDAWKGFARYDAGDAVKLEREKPGPFRRPDKEGSKGPTATADPDFNCVFVSCCRDTVTLERFDKKTETIVTEVVLSGRTVFTLTHEVGHMLLNHGEHFPPDKNTVSKAPFTEPQNLMRAGTDGNTSHMGNKRLWNMTSAGFENQIGAISKSRFLLKF